MHLTRRDEEILSCLCTRVRLFTASQVARYWWRDSKHHLSNARRRLNKLAAHELVKEHSVLAAPLPELSAPVFAWMPGDQTPDFGTYSWSLKSRWKLGPKTTRVYTATAASCRLFGGSSRDELKASFQATHDLGVSQMYLQLLEAQPALAAQWIGEDMLAPYRIGQKLPDAVLAKSPDARPSLVLEFGGSYDKRRLAAFHSDCQERGLKYEVW